MSAFSLLNPLMALGVLGVAAPIIIHFFFRRKAKNLEFSAMRYVLLSYQKVARKLLIQEYILLAARCLMVAFLALALAGPLISRAVQGLKRGERPLAVMMIIDPSPSMTRQLKGVTLFQTGKETALEWMTQLTSGDKAGLIDASRLTDTGLLSSVEDLQKALMQTETSFAPAKLTSAVALAASRLSDVPNSDKVIVIFTDLQRTNWSGSLETKKDMPPIFIVDVSNGMPVKNLSISDLVIKSKSMAREETVEIGSVVKNFGDTNIGQVLVRIEIADKVIAQGFADVPANGEIEKNFILTDTPEGNGILKLEADDGFLADNLVHFLLKGGQEVRVAVVDGDPGTGYLDSETHFLNQALDPRLYARSRVKPKALTLFELEKTHLADYQVLVLANVDKLSPDLTKKVKEFVKNGGGLLLTLGDRVDADIYNAIWGDLLPRELRGVKLAYAGASAEKEIRVMHLEAPAIEEGIHPVLSIFKDPAQGDLGLTGFWKYFLLQQEIAPESKVILRLTNGVPIMVEGNYGSGKVILLASTVDREWNDLCIHPTFLPLIQQTVQYLANALVSKDAGKLVAGQVVELPVTSDITSAKVLGPAGNYYEPELIKEKGARRIRIESTDLPGPYYIKFGREGKKSVKKFDANQADRVLVLNMDPIESDLTPVNADEVMARIRSDAVRIVKPGEPLDAQGVSARETKPYAWLFLYLLVGMTILERYMIRKG